MHMNRGGYLKMRFLATFGILVLLLTGAMAVSTRASVVIPGTVEAEDYDPGGEGVGYHDTTPGNTLDAYRKDDVDVGPVPNTTNQYFVGDIANGEWLKYTLDVSKTDYYDFQFILATAMFDSQTLHVEIDGANVSGSVLVTNTGVWDSYQPASATNIKLTAGIHVMKIVMQGDNFNLDKIVIAKAVAPPANPIPVPVVMATPVVSPTAVLTNPGDAVFTVPCKIQAEDYMSGGEGVGYHDIDTDNLGRAYRQDGVDIRSNVLGGYQVCYIEPGEWLKYHINVPTSGKYNLAASVATDASTSALHIEIDDRDVTGRMSVPNTGDYNTLKPATASDIYLSAGHHVMKVVMDSDQFDLDCIDITSSEKLVPVPKVSTPKVVTTVALPTVHGLKGEYYDDIPDTPIQFFAERRFGRIDPIIDFDWATGSPGPTVKPDYFSVRWTGKIQTTVSGNYQFHVFADDGEKLWVDNTLIIDRWSPHGPYDDFGVISLDANKSYDIKLEYHEQQDRSSVKLMWYVDGQPLEVVPSSALTPAP
jgi:hypothetical protein